MWLPGDFIPENLALRVPFHERLPPGAENLNRQPLDRGFGVPTPFCHQPPGRVHNPCHQPHPNPHQPSRWVHGHPNPHFNAPFLYGDRRGIPPAFVPFPSHRKFDNQIGWTPPMSREHAMDAAARDPEVQKLADTQKQVVSSLQTGTAN